MRRFLPFLLAFTAMPSTAFAYKFSVEMVPMRDGVSLATDVYTPTRKGTYPTVLIRTPYGTDFIPGEAARLICDRMDFNLIVQDTRGRYESEGVDDVFLSDGWYEHQDGYDTLEWISQQRYSNGDVGIFGASALGITGFLAAGTYHPALKTMHIGISPWNFYNTVYQSGVFRDALIVDWLDGQDALYMVDLYKEHPIPDEMWSYMDMNTRSSGITIPIFHWGGWYDIFTEGPLDAFHQLYNQHLAGVTDEQYLLMGPWTHVDDGAFSTTQGQLSYPKDSIVPMDFANPLEWFKVQLQGKSSTPAQPSDWPVRFYVMGDADKTDGVGNTWEIAQNWPIATHEKNLYLGAGGVMAFQNSASLDGSSSFRYDPSAPSPTIGGAELSLPAGPYDQRPLLGAGDSVMFQSEPLSTPVKNVGLAKAELYVSTTAPDTDFTVRLVDIYPDGRTMLVNDGVAKVRYRNGFTQPSFVTPSETVKLEVKMGSTAIAFEAGHRIGIIVASSNARRFWPSQNTDDSVWGTAPAQVAINTIRHGTAYPSRLILAEPEPNTTRPAPKRARPSAVFTQQAMKKLRQNLPLTAAEQLAAERAVGGALMQAMIDTVP